MSLRGVPRGGWEVDVNERTSTPPADSSIAERIFAGDGELARLIRSTDWSSTALGAIEAWPQSLRTAVSICLGSRHPIVLWWGQECWLEILDIIGPMMDHVIATGEATWSEDLFLLMLRSGYLEETYFTFSYSPIRDELGRPSGGFNSCSRT